MSAGRVVVAVGGRASPVAAKAAQLAARLEAELLGLFVEDESWFRMAALPFTRVAGHGPLSAEIDPAVLARAVRACVGEVQRALAAAAGPEVRWSLRTVRGLVVAEAVREAETGDLVVVPAETLVGSGLEVAARARADVLGLRADVDVRRVLVLAPGGEEVVLERALQLAAACGWHVEQVRPQELDDRLRDRETVVAVPAEEVPSALRAGSRSLLLVRTGEPAEEPGVRPRRG